MDQYLNIDVVEFLQEKLQISDFKAEALADRIEERYCKQSTEKMEQKLSGALVKKSDSLKPLPTADAYPVDYLSQKEFERLLEWLLSGLGYNVQPEKYATVFGVYLLAAKDDEKTVFLALRYLRNYTLTDLAISIVEKAKETYGCQRSIIIAPMELSEQAWACARKVGIEIWDARALDKKISEVKDCSEPKVEDRLPKYSGTLLGSLLGLDETEDLIVEPKIGEKYEVYLAHGKYPLLTFQAKNGAVNRCVFRIKNNEPVGELEGVTVIGADDNNRFGPDGIEAYSLIVQYLEGFLE